MIYVLIKFNYILNTSDLSSSNTSRTRSKRSQKKKRNSPKTKSSKENTLPMAHSTMIEETTIMKTPSNGVISDSLNKNDSIVNKTENKTLNKSKGSFEKV